ncbi:Sensor histidine kinase YpdA [Kordia antarctica]|uniref:Sensor histidine kinase YpdA n=1 Tax=Kordia antarctica TaxID=1218801 RepID=A0A7L4ZLX8_9FLAO|nr:histidine kinase [Kordia antarctica]QHI37507.1 Sensor histidine kinase YpdA [Kordia antarctica]
MSEEELERLFMLLSGTAFFVGVAVVILFFVFITRKNKLIMDKSTSEKKMIELELHALRSQMNPHFVYNSLNAIQYYIQLNDIDQSENYLTQFSKLVRQFFEYSRKKTIPIEEEIDLISNYLSLEKLRFEDKLTYEIICDETLDKEASIPSMVLQPIVENAVNHGIFHKKTSGKVTVMFSQLSEDTFCVVVKDDGIGIKKSRKISQNTIQTHDSNSSQVLDERLKLLEQIDNWHVEYTIKDRSELGNEQGTIVTLIFKLPN